MLWVTVNEPSKTSTPKYMQPTFSANCSAFLMNSLKQGTPYAWPCDLDTSHYVTLSSRLHCEAVAVVDKNLNGDANQIPLDVPSQPLSFEQFCKLSSFWRPRCQTGYMYTCATKSTRMQRTITSKSLESTRCRESFVFLRSGVQAGISWAAIL